ncbi:MAG: peptidyl-prolyl cis-trans isomerase, partial [Phycisphaerae bacterium]|nr:peptidyl-prolyl cis-trans isomerase [Phycisphaerae bacterium]
SPKKVQMQIICAVDKSFLSKVPTQPADNRELLAKGLAKGRIAEAVRALAAGDDFADVAKRLSSGTKANSGGLWPLMAKGNFRYENVERAAFELVEGQVSDVIETESGYYIVKAAKVVPAEVVSFEEAQRQIEWDLRQQQYQKLTEQHFQRLMDQATIVQSDRFVALAVDRAVKEHWGQ